MIEGSNVIDGYLYHDVPGISMPAHRPGSEQRAKAIAAAIDLRGKRVCDLGCGSGGISIWLSHYGARKILGYDYDHHMIDIGKQAVAKKNVSVELVYKDITPNFVSQLEPCDVIVWLSQWMWFVKQHGLDAGYQALYDCSKSAACLVFETAVTDGMSPLPAGCARNQQDVLKVLYQNTCYSNIRQCSMDAKWGGRVTYVCTKPKTTWSTASRINGVEHRKWIQRTDRREVMKRFRSPKNCAREIKVLKQLQSYPYCPRLLKWDETSITTSYEGPMASSLPEADYQGILEMLRKEKLQHRDIRPENLCWNGEHVVLIDYEWTVRLGEHEAESPPPELGSRYKAPAGFNDAWSLSKVKSELSPPVPSRNDPPLPVVANDRQGDQTMRKGMIVVNPLKENARVVFDLSSREATIGKSSLDGLLKSRVLVVGIYLADKPNNVERIAAEFSLSDQYQVTQRWIALGGSPSSPQLRALTSQVIENNQPKVPLLNRLLSQEDLSGFEYVIMSDDDITLHPQFVDKYLEAQRRLGFCLAQPARTIDSKIDHQIVKQQEGYFARETLFVEIGPVVSVHRSAYEFMFPLDETSPMGWGLENVWSYEVSRRQMKMGIVDAYPVEHRMRPGGKYYNSRAAAQDSLKLLKSRPHIPLKECYKTLDAIPYRRQPEYALRNPRKDVKIDVYSMFWNEEAMLPYFLRHYGQFARKIILFDNESTDRSRAIAESHPLVKLRTYRTDGEYREDALLYAKGQAWREDVDRPDWVIACDIDEFLVHPDLLGYLAECKSQGITVPVPRGWNMMADEFPTTAGQIYDEVCDGVPSERYSKNCIFDPTAIEDIGYQAGCHSYQPKGRVFEHFSGQLRLLHFNALGAQYLAARHASQLGRIGEYNRQRRLAVHLMPGETCLKAFASRRQQVRRISPDRDPRKLHIGYDFNRLPGWENHVRELDVARPLPFDDGTFQFIFGEDVLEYQTAVDCIQFLKECFRCLESGGVLRLCVPSIEKLVRQADSEYLQFVEKRFGESASVTGAINALVRQRKHQSLWIPELVSLIARVYGFIPSVCKLQQSAFEEMRRIDGCRKAIGEHNSAVEMAVVECRKP